MLALAGCGTCIQGNISLPDADRDSGVPDMFIFYRPRFNVMWRKEKDGKIEVRSKLTHFCFLLVHIHIRLDLDSGQTVFISRAGRVLVVCSVWALKFWTFKINSGSTESDDPKVQHGRILVNITDCFSALNQTITEFCRISGSA